MSFLDCEAAVADAFRLTFPDYLGALEGATSETVPGWDSVQLVTLLAIIEETLGRPVPLEHLSDLLSYRDIVRTVCGGA
jgi:hypothetical protein